MSSHLFLIEQFPKCSLLKVAGVNLPRKNLLFIPLKIVRFASASPGWLIIFTQSCWSNMRKITLNDCLCHLVTLSKLLCLSGRIVFTVLLLFNKGKFLLFNSHFLFLDDILSFICIIKFYHTLFLQWSCC